MMENLRVLTDHELLEMSKAGDSLAFGAIYHRYAGVLVLHALDILDDEDDARDVIQEVFGHLWARRESMHVIGNLKAYLYSAVRNSVLNQLKKEKHISRMLEGFRAEEQRREREAYDADADAVLLGKIEAEIDRLPRKMREVFLLSRRGDMTYEQISSRLNIAPNTVRKQVSNALRIIRVNLRSLFWNFF